MFDQGAGQVIGQHVMINGDDDDNNDDNNNNNNNNNNNTSSSSSSSNNLATRPITKLVLGALITPNGTWQYTTKSYQKG